MLPIQPHTVKLVIQYISPPSQITGALPPHLISTPLRQRHHYLQISPDNVIEYLCWPSPNNARIMELLDHSIAASDEDQTRNYPTRYTSDAESTFAHVHIFSREEGLRMLFQWDEVDGWKYHDLQLMPFPASSFPTLQEAVSNNSPPEAELDRPSHFVAEADHIDDDPYWDAYGAAGDGLNSPLPLRGATASAPVEGEDAYWEQYAAVQGSADSTIPSPLPNNRKLRPVTSNDHEVGFPFPSQSNPIAIPADAIHSRSPVSKLGPPSPNTLAHLLSIISPRSDAYPVSDEPHPTELSSTVSPEISSPEMTVADSVLLTPPPPNGEQIATLVSPVAVKLNGFPLSNARHAIVDDTEDRALTDSIKGLYYLWKAGRRKQANDKASDMFLRIVQAAITQE
ncbi:hypothetical protein PAXRUDRAFT_142024 [Paxillus rubicundulus Ve08.2h10]|uniref:Uncharacterized protein n=1 Tax=Paxillus rubicundulus Ve08.2h10 TaxID=930991 RepID=A0A0D0DQN5_9AGAM|nr:hypothetical protein PAXRUDRAFT_142024 [Paxillus rubicundulus Ve08.2h10]